jgi:hypothetical protein
MRPSAAAGARREAAEEQTRHSLQVETLRQHGWPVGVPQRTDRADMLGVLRLDDLQGGVSPNHRFEELVQLADSQERHAFWMTG